MGVIKKTKEIQFFTSDVDIAGGGGNYSLTFDFDSTSDGCVIDLIVTGKTSCATT